MRVQTGSFVRVETGSFVRVQNQCANNLRAHASRQSFVLSGSSAVRFYPEAPITQKVRYNALCPGPKPGPRARAGSKVRYNAFYALLELVGRFFNFTPSGPGIPKLGEGGAEPGPPGPGKPWLSAGRVDDLVPGPVGRGGRPLWPQAVRSHFGSSHFGI